MASEEPESIPGPIAPDPIRQAFSWHEQRLSIRGLFPEGLKKGVSIQHKFDDDEVITMKKAENGLIVSFHVIKGRFKYFQRHIRNMELEIGQKVRSKTSKKLVI